MSKRAIILAGGKGTRLRPYTSVLPKPLMPLGEKPILEIIINYLVKHDFTHITITVNHLAEIIRAFFGDGAKWGVKLDYSIEDKPLSTMGPLKLINDLPENFLVMNGDILTDLDFSQLYSKHVNSKNLFTISSIQREQINNYGVLKIDDNNKLFSFEEKPTVVFDVSMGIYMVNRNVLDYIPPNIAYGFDDLMLDLIKINKLPAVERYNGYWLDIGRPDDYEKAVDDFENSHSIFQK